MTARSGAQAMRSTDDGAARPVGGVWHNGDLRPGCLCPFCLGARFFLRMKGGRPAFWRCRACDGAGSPAVDAPMEMRIGAAQGRFLKPYPGDRTPTPAASPLDRSAPDHGETHV